MCESAADGGETTLLGSAGPTLEDKHAQEIKVLPEESDKTSVSERPLEKQDLDEGESLPTLGPDNFALAYRRQSRRKSCWFLG